jgi:NaMN:DMB phosphoribosyltransferase
VCEVTTALAIVSAISAGVGVYAQGQNAKAQVRALDTQRQAQAEELAAKRDMTLGQRVAAARREAAAKLVAAGESGVGGTSAVLDIQQTFGRANQDAGVIAKQSEFEDRASAVTYASGVAGVEKPNLVDAGLSIAGGYARGRELGDKLSIRKRQLMDAPSSTSSSSSRYA